MEFYDAQASDPEWLVRAGTFHGHLGPWVTVGAMIGRDAVQRLQSPGHWTIQVVCWMPPEKQRTPFSCMLDGLQVTSGATMGKRNIRFDYDPAIVRNGQPVVYVIRQPSDAAPSAGLVYRLTDHLVSILAAISPDRLEEISRDLATHGIEELFEVQPMTAEELASVEAP